MSAPARRGFALTEAWLGAGLLLAAHLLRAPFHEWWRDEWQTWLTVRASAGLGELFAHTRFDGHPTLWPLAVWLASRLVPAPWAMTVLHALIAAGFGFVVLRHAPFPRWATLLLLLGYFPFFEYAVINRSYALGALCAALVCTVLAGPRWRPAALCASLAALAWTSIYGTLLALGFLLILTAEAAWGPRLPALRDATRRGILTALGAAAVLVGLAILDAVPAPGSGFATGWYFGWDGARLAQRLGGVARALLPLPAPGPHFWNSHFLDGHRALQAGLGVALVGFVGWLLRGAARSRLLWSAGVAALLAFAYVKHAGSMRHLGTYALCALCAAWLAGGEARASLAGTPRLGAAPRWLVAGLLAAHVLAALYATGMDLRHPFSASVAAVRWLRAQSLDHLPLVVESDTRGQSLGALLGRPIFFVKGRRWGTYARLDAFYPQQVTPDAVAESLALVAAERGGPVLLAASGPDARRVAPAGLRELAAFDDAIVESETYVLYVAGEAVQ